MITLTAMLNGTGADKTLVLVRHGLTDWNAEQRFQGQLDIPLNPTGRLQAKTLKAHLAGTFDQVYSSPLRRALETAKIISATTPIITDARLAEIHHGVWQGKTSRDIATCWPDDWRQWNEEPKRFTPFAGESPGHVRARVEDFISSMQGEAILCISHGVVIQAFISILLGCYLPEQNMSVPRNGSIHTFHFHKKTLRDYHAEEIG